MPARFVDGLGFGGAIRTIPIVGNVSLPTIGLVVPRREPMTPLVAEARRLATTLAA
jgi:hypothetical protein